MAPLSEKLPSQSFFSGKSALITGGLGFIGSTLARELVAAGARVTLLDSMIPEQGGNRFNIIDIEDRVSVRTEDLRNRAALPEIVAGQDFIFNLAGQTSHLDSMEQPNTDLAINCAAQLSLLEACRRHHPATRIIFASTRQIYGRPSKLPVDESHPLHPVDINGIHKLAAESYHLLYHRVYGVRSISLRLTNTIGPRMRVRDARQTFLGVWIRQLLEGRPIEVWGGAQLRDFTDVDDAVEALLLAASHDAAPGEVFNLGGNRVLNLRELAALLVELHGSGEYRVHEFPPDRQRIDIGDYHADFSRIRTLLGWEPRIPLRATLERTLAYYREHLPRYV